MFVHILFVSFHCFLPNNVPLKTYMYHAWYVCYANSAVVLVLVLVLLEIGKRPIYHASQATPGLTQRTWPQLPSA